MRASGDREEPSASPAARRTVLKGAATAGLAAAGLAAAPPASADRGRANAALRGSNPSARALECLLEYAV
ncbi:hypothetical protein ABZ214_07045, partial [Streptomyces iakyrus]